MLRNVYTCDWDIENKTNKLKHALYTYLQLMTIAK